MPHHCADASCFVSKMTLWTLCRSTQTAVCKAYLVVIAVTTAHSAWSSLLMTWAYQGSDAGNMLQDVVVGKPRDGDDRVAWLLDHQRFDKALSVLETDRGLKKSTHAQVSWAPCILRIRCSVQTTQAPIPELSGAQQMHRGLVPAVGAFGRTEIVQFNVELEILASGDAEVPGVPDISEAI